MAAFFTADWHLGHKNIIKYCTRPFKTVEEMDQTIISNHKKILTPDDDLYVIGDVSMNKTDYIKPLLEQIPCRMHLIYGNHDNLNILRPFFDSVKIYDCIKLKDPDASQGIQRIVLLHYAMRVWDQSHYGSWQLYGHSHGTLPDDPNLLAFDAGVDCWNFGPVSYDEAKKRMKLKTFVPITSRHDNKKNSHE